MKDYLVQQERSHVIIHRHHKNHKLVSSVFINPEKQRHPHPSLPFALFPYSVIIIPPTPPTPGALPIIPIIILIIAIVIIAPTPPTRRDMTLRPPLLFASVRIQQSLNLLFHTTQQPTARSSAMVRRPLFPVGIFKPFLLLPFLVSALQFVRSHCAGDDSADGAKVAAVARFVSQQPASGGASESGAPFCASAFGATSVPAMATVAVAVTVEVGLSAVA